MAKSPEEQAQTMRDSLVEKTGKSAAQWAKVIAKSGLEKHMAIVKMLKTDHGITHGYANFVAHEVKSAAAPSASGDGDQSLVDAQYAGAKGDLRPIYDALIKVVAKLGGDVEIAPKKTYVSLRRSKQFGLIQASTKTRVDVGLNLKGEAPTDRLEASGSFNAMVSHRVRLSNVGDVDAELTKWLKLAFQNAK